MKSLLTRRPPSPRAEPTEPEREWDVDEDPAEMGGWSTGARANTTAVIRWAVWGLVILGPVLGAAAFLSVPAPAGPARPQTAAAPAASGSQGAAGFAQLFVAAYIGAGDGDQSKLAAYYPGATNLRLEGTPMRRSGEQLAVVRLRQTDRDVWSVTVGARITDTASGETATAAAAAGRRDAKAEAAAAAAASVHYFQVPVATAPAGGGATGFVALAMPAEVAAPVRVEAPGLVYGPMRPALPGDPRTQAVTAFLDAYLAGSGELDRYLAPGTQLTAIAPAPYTGLAVDQLAVEGERGGEPVASVPGDGSRSRLLVVLRATGHDGVRVPLTYALTLSARAGRWEIAALDGAPAEAPARAPAPSTGTSTAPSGPAATRTSTPAS